MIQVLHFDFVFRLQNTVLGKNWFVTTKQQHDCMSAMQMIWMFKKNKTMEWTVNNMHIKNKLQNMLAQLLLLTGI